MISDNSVNIMVAHIRESHIISLQKRQSGIIILKIESISHPLRHLVDKAENTFVPAGTIFIHQAAVKLNPQIFLEILFYLQFPFFLIRFSNQNLKIFIIDQIVIIKHIFNLLSIHRQQLIARFQFQLFCDTSRQNTFDYMSGFFHYHTLHSA